MYITKFPAELGQGPQIVLENSIIFMIRSKIDSDKIVLDRFWDRLL